MDQDMLAGGGPGPRSVLGCVFRDEQITRGRVLEHWRTPFSGGGGGGGGWLALGGFVLCAIELRLEDVEEQKLKTNFFFSS
ncbi:hypothetical protein CH63R_10485 [Colletotrichum higginsianum IMI 349063]|uniref:Uncharacterized protein n=1 Tax=Colletotrichum higginsianum (strain IMI 349063) TaxID=759273 RepID=A0A1B7Y324_COLHI|nr:uncharacterized protein CH63R_10485 [Colletotrichum higginsianum IMI 349063]OBR06365.1 hypothetical protein CH63R_10485 [Colletotrichum higginsianum IMI 349063]